LISFAYLVRNKKIYLILLLPFFLGGLFGMVYTLTFERTFTSGLFNVVVETNPEESLEFLKSYFRLTTLLLVVLYGLGILWLYRKITFFPPTSFKAKTTVFIGVTMLIIAAQQLAYHERYRDVLPGTMGQLADGWSKYLQLQSELANRPKKLKEWEGSVVKESFSKPQTYVVVIGESATRGHHSIYGYQRETNPELEKLKNELIIFDKMKSSYAVTYLALAETLTNSSRQRPIPFTETVDVVGLSKLAGFDTWWLSTQPKNEGTTLSASSFADHRRYKSGLDEVLLPEFDKALASEQKDKVIFVHIRGSHLSYHKRYPENFNHFTKRKNIRIYTRDPTQQQIDVVNAYDNSIRYTDWFLKQLIEKLKGLDGINALVYFSDHGEEVYDYEDFVGHELKRTTPVMFEVPFFIWTNQEYQHKKTNAYNQLRSFSNKMGKTDQFFELFQKLALPSTPQKQP
jgi:heptose-I-phosphate ethanolaminephosphotransferase